ncbi:MAG: GNAT family protein [Candidatus Celaenobacter polaris]|nr:GNAT family protein [Candidatus Celaenobacter polaris]
MVFETTRLIARRPTTKDEDVDFYFQLWNEPRVMKNVGFPKGLLIRREEIISQLARAENSEFDHTLIVIDKESNTPIGECKLGSPDEKGISTTDVKLLPLYWNKGFGTEIKTCLINYIFTHTNCKAIQATPNKSNIASQKMQEKVGAKRVSEGTYHFPESMQSYTKPVEYILYQIDRAEWEKR